MATKKKVPITLHPGAGHLVHGAPRAPLRPTAPAVPVPSRARPRGEQLVRDVVRLRTDIAANFYRMGLALRDLSRPDVYRALGHESFADLLDARDLAGRMTAFKLISIVESLPQPLAQRLGVEKSYDAIRYARLAHPRRDVAEVLATDPAIRVSGRARVPLFAISSRALHAAVLALRDGNRTNDDAGARAKRAARSLAQRLDHVGIDADRVRSTRRGAAWRIRIELSPEEAEELAGLLRAARK